MKMHESEHINVWHYVKVGLVEGTMYVSEKLRRGLKSG